MIRVFFLQFLEGHVPLGNFVTVGSDFPGFDSPQVPQNGKKNNHKLGRAWLSSPLLRFHIASRKIGLRISCLNTMLALVVQLFTEQNARMKTLEERSNDNRNLPEVRHSWWLDRPYSTYPKNGRECQGQCPEEQLDVNEVPGGWEQLQLLEVLQAVLLYYPLERILLILVSFWLLLSRIFSCCRSSVRLPSPEVEIHEVNSTPSRSKGSSRAAKKERDDTNRTVSGASGRRLQRELQRELWSKERNEHFERDSPRRDERREERSGDRTPQTGPPFRHPRVRRRSRSADRANRADEREQRSSSDSSRTDVQRKNQRTFEILCRQLPQTPPLRHRSTSSFAAFVCLKYP